MAQSYLLPDGRILRYTFGERLVHWIAGASYVYLLLTGLAFWSPWLFWIAVLLGGAPVSRALHPWAGLIFSGAVLLMYQMWGQAMRITEVDRAWNRAMSHYIRNEDEAVPDTGRFNAGQKYLFWLFFWGGMVLLLTGLVLWFSDSLPWSLRFLRYVSVLLHPIAALLTIGGFILHVYMGTAVERGAFGAVITGQASETFLKKYHRLWYEEITGRSPARK
jgi:formate dehydrogenase subunit gamma